MLAISPRLVAATFAAVGALAASAPQANAISAHPTNEGSKQQRQKCTQHTARLQNAQGMQLQVDGQKSTGAASNPKLDAAIDAAENDGCFVIY